MGRVNLMGFRPVDRIPPARNKKGKSIYDGIITTVHDTGMMYGQDVKDQKRANNLSVQLRAVTKRLGFDDVQVVQRHTAVYIRRKEN